MWGVFRYILYHNSIKLKQCNYSMERGYDEQAGRDSMAQEKQDRSKSDKIHEEMNWNAQL